MKKNSRKNYSPTKIKLRNSLTNISYNRLKKKNYENSSFITDSFSFIFLNFNPFNLERKFIENNEMGFIKALWEKCVSRELLEFINQKEIFMKLNKLPLKYTTAN